jgi:hypothetical protein
MLSPRAATAILVAPFVIAAVDWSRREAPSVPCGESRATEEWLSGLAPAAFLTGVVCLVVAVRISALHRAGRAGVPTLAAAAAWLVCAAAWWVGGEGSPLSTWAALAYLLLIPGVPAALTLIVAIAIRPAWGLVTTLAWLCAIVLVPGGVAVVETWGVDYIC